MFAVLFIVAPCSRRIKNAVAILVSGFYGSDDVTRIWLSVAMPVANSTRLLVMRSPCSSEFFQSVPDMPNCILDYSEKIVDLIDPALQQYQPVMVAQFVAVHAAPVIHDFPLVVFVVCHLALHVV
jgi:hypothetical protein